MCILCFSLYLLFFFIPYSHHQHFRLNRLSVRMHTHFIARKEKSLLGLHNTLNTTRSRQHISLPPVSRSFLSPHRHLCQRINSLACRLSIKAQNHTHTHTHKKELTLFILAVSLQKSVYTLYILSPLRSQPLHLPPQRPRLHFLLLLWCFRNKLLCPRAEFSQRTRVSTAVVFSRGDEDYRMYVLRWIKTLTLLKGPDWSIFSEWVSEP